MKSKNRGHKEDKKKGKKKIEYLGKRRTKMTDREKFIKDWRWIDGKPYERSPNTLNYRPKRKVKQDGDEFI